MMHLRILPLSEDIADMYKSHTTFYEGDSGLDLFVVKEQTIKAGETSLIPLGIKAAACTDDKAACSFMIMPRSSISKTPLRLCNSIGLIDAGYRGEILCCIDNIKSYDYTVKKGDRLVQAVGFTGGGVSFELVSSLEATQRGEAGHGSTSKSTVASTGGSAENKATDSPFVAVVEDTRDVIKEMVASGISAIGSKRHSEDWVDENEEVVQKIAKKTRIAEDEKTRIAEDEKTRIAEDEKTRIAEDEKTRIAEDEKTRIAEDEKTRIAEDEKTRICDKKWELSCDKKWEICGQLVGVVGNLQTLRTIGGKSAECQKMRRQE